MHLAAWVAVAFAAGAVAGGAAVYEGAPTFDLDPAPPRARSGGAIVRIENVGTRDVNATLEVSRGGGGAFWSATAYVQALGHEDLRVEGAGRGEHLAWGRFTWSAPPNRGTGDLYVPFDTADCPSGTLYAIFRVDTTRGISFPDGDITECR